MLHRIFGLYIENILQSFFYFPCIVICFFSLSDENGTKNFTVTTEILVQYNFLPVPTSHECHKCISFLAVKRKGTVPIISGTITAIFYFQKRVSKSLLLNANSAIYQLYHGKNKSIFNKLMRFPLYKTNTPSWILIVLAH